MLDGISVIAFDIDGTLYSSHRFYLRIIPYFLKNIFFFVKYNKVRKILHRTAPLADFYEYQARLLSEITGKTPEAEKERIRSIVYDGMKPYFEKIRTFKYVEETFKKIRAAGYRIALLSDFPPEQKGRLWNLSPYCDLILGTESSGALKPSKYPFGIMCSKLGVKPEQVLYVGNSVRYDVEGSKKAGMKSAFILTSWRKLFNIPLKSADICFSNYRQFADIVLK